MGAVVVLAIWEKRGGSVEWISLLPNDIFKAKHELKYTHKYILMCPCCML